MNGWIDWKVSTCTCVLSFSEREWLSDCEPCNTVPFSICTQRVPIHKILPNTLIFTSFPLSPRDGAFYRFFQLPVTWLISTWAVIMLIIISNKLIAICFLYSFFEAIMDHWKSSVLATSRSIQVMAINDFLSLLAQYCCSSPCVRAVTPGITVDNEEKLYTSWVTR